MNRSNLCFAAIFSLLLFGLSSTVSADIITIQADDWGWYNYKGSHNVDNTNLYTGGSENAKAYNSFINFDVSGIADGSQIESITLNFMANVGRYSSQDPVEIVEIWDVDTTPGFRSGIEIYNDLMSGTQYGTVSIVKGDTNAMPGFSLALASESYTDLLADDLFSLGMHLASLTDGNQQALWVASGTATLPATLTVEYTPPPPSPV